MASEEVPIRVREFTDRLAALLSEFADISGPVFNEDDVQLCAMDIVDARPIPNTVLTEWVTVMVWQGLDDGAVYYTKMCQPGMLRHHQEGLLRRWLLVLAGSDG